MTDKEHLYDRLHTQQKGHHEEGKKQKTSADRRGDVLQPSHGQASSRSRSQTTQGSQQTSQRGQQEQGKKQPPSDERRGGLHHHSHGHHNQTNPGRPGRRAASQVTGNRAPPIQDFSGGRWHCQSNPITCSSQSSVEDFFKDRGEGQRSIFQEYQPRMGIPRSRTRNVQNVSELSCDSGSLVRSSMLGRQGMTKPKYPRNFETRDGRRGFQGEHKLGHRSLTEISMLEPSEIVMKLAAPRSGLREFLEQSDIQSQLIELILEVLHKAIGCKSSRQNLLHLLANVQDSTFLKKVLPFYLLVIEPDSKEQMQEKLPFISYILTLLLELISVFPSSCAMEVSLVDTLLQTAVAKLLSNGVSIPETTTKNMTTLHTFLQHLQEKKREGTLRSDSYTYLMENHEGSDVSDFQHISIFPTYDDIYLEENPVMRPNILNGSYPGANAYLDTHFRLLREDFIRPLRDGISQLLSLQGKEMMKAKFNDIRVYFSIQILMPICTRTGIVHQVKFSVENLKHVRWESSKRLLFGALVCLSKDKFKTMLFATVADRNEKELLKGIITLNFTEESRLSLAEMKPDNNFLMVETNAYFEAYRHILEGLKEMASSEIPLQKYIVHCEPNVSAPAYLESNSKAYSLKELVLDRSLALREVHDSSDDMSDSESGSDIEEVELSDLMERHLGDFCTKQRVPLIPASNSSLVQPVTGFDVLNFKSWPSKEQLKLDCSQLKAFQAALTKELAIIQGPPGTGKTYVGLKVVKALLANSDLWNTTGHSPILVVCFTNHALDQFLEGIHSFLHGGIIRVGSRSNSEIMKNCSLAKIRRDKGALELMPGHLRALHYELKDEQRKIEEVLGDKAASLQAANRGILKDSILEKYISDKHLESLLSIQDSLDEEGFLAIESNPLLKWLDVSVLDNKGKQSTGFTLANGQGVCGETHLSEWLELEKSMDENYSNEESGCLDKEANEDLITVAEEPELLQAERMMDGDDIKRQISEAYKRVAKKKKEILSFVPNFEHDEEDVDKSGINRSDAGQWEITKKMKKKLQRIIRHELDKTNNMDEELSENIEDLWQLPRPQRWDLYRLWRSKYLIDIRRDICNIEDEYQQVAKRMNELRDQEDLLILRKARIIGMTTTGAAKYRKVLQEIRPKIIIVEEAAEVLESHIVATLSSDCEHLILIGDHQQLRPTANVYDLAKNFNLEVSMFERLVKMNVQYVRLDYQHRMRPEIAQLLTPHIYDDLKNHQSVYQYDRVKGVAGNLFFVEHDQFEEHIQEGKSHKNTHEAAFVKALCRYFICQGYEPSQITVLTTYSGQLFCLKSLMPRAQFEGVRVCVVDKYQGEENEIIILSLVRSNPEGRVGFLSIPNRVCVALSRAKKGLFCIGNMQMLSKVPLWENIIEILKSNGQIGKELKLCCENHPKNICYVSKAEDFASAPEGGCLEACEYRLECGHACTMVCHPYDPEHRKFECRKPCEKILCDEGHKCEKICFQDCGSCMVLMEKKIPKCGHVQSVPCSVQPCTFICQEPCVKMLSCGHKCVRTCGNSCTRDCPAVVKVELECGHSRSVVCHRQKEAERRGEKIPCFAKCPEVLACGHVCSGSCSECAQGKLHVACAAQCDRVLFCSHQCNGKCSTNCACCLRVCENKCFHRKCSGKCSEPCPPCTNPCGWKCPHAACSKLCWEACDREPCDMPCGKKLRACGHPCIGFCGEPCPSLCRECNPEEVRELWFGKEADPESRFIQLRDCRHIFEVSGFTQWMNQQETDGVVRLKTCPKCLVPIRQNLRYGSKIKEALSDVETVKSMIVQSWVHELEKFLADNKNVLQFSAWADAVLEKLMEPQVTIRDVFLISEKLNSLCKIGSIKEAAAQLPQHYQREVEDKIKRLSNFIEDATSKSDILGKQDELVSIAQLTELRHAGAPLPADSLFMSKLQSFYRYQSKIKPLSLKLELVSSIQHDKYTLDTNLLRQDRWHECANGHIYSSQKLEFKAPVCPQCDSSINNQDDNSVELNNTL
ncbi:NFX1-type zinc finger-containing protein 1-like isoform X2 [Lissotriton helveticus]